MLSLKELRWLGQLEEENNRLRQLGRLLARFDKHMLSEDFRKKMRTDRREFAKVVGFRGPLQVGFLLR